MFCTKCGKELEEGVKFCTACGTPVEESAAPETETNARKQPGFDVRDAAEKAGEAISGVAHKAQTAGRQLWDKVSDGVEDVLDGDAAEKGKSFAKKLGWKLPVIAVAAVVVIALLIALFSGAFVGAKGKLAAAAGDSLEAYYQAYEDAGLPDLELLYSKAARESFSVELEELEGSSMLEGLGLRFETAYDLSKRAVSAQITPFMGAVDLLTLQLAVDDDEIFVASPQLLEGQFYGLDTETVGADLSALGAEIDGMKLEQLSFNLFDMAEYLMKATQPGREYEKAMEQAVKDLIGAIEVKKDGKSEIDVNGSTVKCALYRVTVPAQAVVTFAKTLETLPNDVNYQEIFVALLGMMGLDDDTVGLIMDELGEDAFTVQTTDFSKNVEGIMSVLGDVELQAYVKGERLMAVVYEGLIDDESVKAGVYLGGGTNYVDDFSIAVSVNGDEEGFVLTSSGNHTGKGGTFVNDTVVEIISYGQREVVLESALNYNTKEKEDNFIWVLEAGEVTVDAEGTLTVKGESFSLLLDELEVRESSANVITLSISLSVDEYSPLVSPGKSVMLADLTAEDVTELANQIMTDAMSVLGTLAAEVPALGGLLYGF